MGTLLESIKKETPKRRKIDNLLDALDEKDRKDLMEAFADPSITTTAIFAALKKRGMNVTYGMLYIYRKGLNDGTC